MKFPSQMFLILPLSLPLFPFLPVSHCLTTQDIQSTKLSKVANSTYKGGVFIDDDACLAFSPLKPQPTQRRANLNHNIIVFRSCRAFDLRSSLHHQDSKSRPTPTWWPPALKFFPSSNVDSVNLMPGRRDWYERKQCVQKREAACKEDTTQKLVNIDVGWIGDERLPN